MKRKFNVIVATLLIVSMCLNGCALFKSQKLIDDILPEHGKRLYNTLDLMPYKAKEIKNAQALYAMELQTFFTENTTTESEAKRTKEEQAEFVKELRYRTANYKVVREKYGEFYDDEGKEKNIDTIENDYKAYNNLKNADGADTIKKYNGSRLDGHPFMTIKIILDTATYSEVDPMYIDAECEIYRQLTLDTATCKSYKIGEIYELEVPVNNKSKSKETVKKKMFYVATDSFTYKDGVNDICYYIADSDGNSSRRLVDGNGGTLELYEGNARLQFMKNTKVATAESEARFMDKIINGNLTSYSIYDIVNAALCGGYIKTEYMEYVYSNAISVNKKGYITALSNYTDQKIDIQYNIDMQNKAINDAMENEDQNNFNSNYDYGFGNMGGMNGMGMDGMNGMGMEGMNGMGMDGMNDMGMDGI